VYQVLLTLKQFSVKLCQKITGALVFLRHSVLSPTYMFIHMFIGGLQWAG